MNGESEVRAYSAGGLVGSLQTKTERGEGQTSREISALRESVTSLTLVIDELGKRLEPAMRISSPEKDNVEVTIENLALIPSAIREGRAVVQDATSRIKDFISRLEL